MTNHDKPYIIKVGDNMAKKKITVPIEDVIMMMYRLISSFMDPYDSHATFLIKLELKRAGYLPANDEIKP